MSATDLLPVAIVLVVLLWPDVTQIEALGWSFTKKEKEKKAEQEKAKVANWQTVGTTIAEKAQILGLGDVTPPPEPGAPGSQPPQAEPS